MGFFYQILIVKTRASKLDSPTKIKLVYFALSNVQWDFLVFWTDDIFQINCLKLNFKHAALKTKEALQLPHHHNNHHDESKTVCFC